MADKIQAIINNDQKTITYRDVIKKQTGYQLGLNTKDTYVDKDIIFEPTVQKGVAEGKDGNVALTKNSEANNLANKTAKVNIQSEKPTDKKYIDVVGSGSSKITQSGWFEKDEALGAGSGNSQYITIEEGSVTLDGGNGLTKTEDSVAGSVSMSLPTADPQGVVLGDSAGADNEYKSVQISAQSAEKTVTGRVTRAAVTGIVTEGYIDKTPTALAEDSIDVNGTVEAATENKFINIPKATVEAGSASSTVSAIEGNGVTTATLVDSAPTVPGTHYIKVDTSGTGASSISKAGWVDAKQLTTASATGTQYISLGNMTLSNEVPVSEENSYTDISENAPVLISGKSLYINEGYTGNVKISLAKLVPDGANIAVTKGVDLIYKGVTAYDNDGKLVTGTMPDAVLGAMTTSEKKTKTITTLNPISYENGKFKVTSEPVTGYTLAKVTCSKTGYITTSDFQEGDVEFFADVDATLNSLAATVSSSSTKTIDTSVAKVEKASGETFTDASNGVATSTAPSDASMPYVKVSSIGGTTTLAFDVNVTQEGYATQEHKGITAGEIDVTANGSGNYYIPVKMGTLTGATKSVTLKDAEPTLSTNGSDYELTVTTDEFKIAPTLEKGWINNTVDNTISAASRAYSLGKSNISAGETTVTLEGNVKKQVYRVSTTRGYTPSAGLQHDIPIFDGNASVYSN